MKSTTAYGKSGENGELFLYRSGILFATAERFTALIEESSDSGASTGYRIRLILNGVTIADEIGAKTHIHAIQTGDSPTFDFQGQMKRVDGWAERVIFRQCVPVGAVDIPGMVSGYVDTMAFAVNELPEQTKKSLGIN